MHALVLLCPAGLLIAGPGLCFFFLIGLDGVRDTKAQRKQGERSQLVYLEREQDDEEEEEGKETGEGLNRPATIRKQTAWACKPETCGAINDERMHGQTAESSSRVIIS